MNESELSLEISSDLDYEKMVININYKNNTIAILNCDDGIENTIISFLDNRSDEVIWNLNYKNFLNILNRAFIKLKEVNEE